MDLSKEAIESFKETYKKDFKETVSNSEAKEMAVRLLRFVHLILRPIPEDKKGDFKRITQDGRNV
ncbi:MAG: hypothetical protein Athens101426_356 [Parcubacteria group bacterium Athens1014_26]|nr:MAG: hypothetical protein Athens101426_356 [Parcubacteria group bacterium Athens1014_26]